MSNSKMEIDIMEQYAKCVENERTFFDLFFL